MDLSLKGKLAIVGGASQGIGYAIAHLLASEGASVAMIARRREPLDEAVRRVREETGSNAYAIAADIRRADDCTRIFDEALAVLGSVDILVNNDGAPPLGLLSTFDDAAWDKALQQNLMSVVRLSRSAVPELTKRGGGRIVNITALSTLQPMPKFGLSVASWAAVLGYAKTLSLEVAADNITVNSICPGRIATGRLAKVFGNQHEALDDSQRASLASDVPMRRIGSPDEIAGLVAFLASPWAGYITGHVFHVDGGRRASLL